jgi:NAD(P)-dependent dehydrogenase (short-subunit alcohol dehydrogenase family)
MNVKFDGRTIFISGATSGLGYKLAKHFVGLGDSVVLCARSEEDVLNTVAELRSIAQTDQKILGFPCDVTNALSVADLFSKLEEEKVYCEVLICNAGVIGPMDKYLNSLSSEWENAFNINLYGMLNLISQVLPKMVAKGSGKVVHVSGGGATSPLFGMSSYAASKTAAVRVIETLALEYRDFGIMFNSIAPGMLKTKLLEQMIEAGPTLIGESLFLKSSMRAQSVEDSTGKAIALVDFLASDVSFGISGKLISAEWDNWQMWPNHLDELNTSDLYTLRRITGHDRGQTWGDL